MFSLHKMLEQHLRSNFSEHQNQNNQWMNSTHHPQRLFTIDDTIERTHFSQAKPKCILTALLII